MGKAEKRTRYHKGATVSSKLKLLKISQIIFRAYFKVFYASKLTLLCVGVYCIDLIIVYLFD